MVVLTAFYWPSFPALIGLRATPEWLIRRERCGCKASTINKIAEYTALQSQEFGVISRVRFLVLKRIDD